MRTYDVPWKSKSKDFKVKTTIVFGKDRRPQVNFPSLSTDRPRFPPPYKKPTRNYSVMNILNEKKPTTIIIMIYQILGLEPVVHRFSR